jgi:hypothetical protein
MKALRLGSFGVLPGLFRASEALDLIRKRHSGNGVDESACSGLNLRLPRGVVQFRS